MEQSLMLEVFSATTGLGGALLLAMKNRYAAWTWPVWLLSNLGWIAFGLLHQHMGLVAQNLGFVITSCIGVWVWIVNPYWQARGNAVRQTPSLRAQDKFI